MMIEGRIDQAQGKGRLSEYLKNGVMDFLDAITLKYGIQVIFADTREEAEERVANLAAMHYAYFYAEHKGRGRSLSENVISAQRKGDTPQQDSSTALRDAVLA